MQSKSNILNGEKKIPIVEYEKWFQRPKACIKGSDAHDINYPFGKLKDENSKPIEKYCWIKSDPTFEGLMQITNEPDRVFIGEEPPVLNRIKNNPTKYIDTLEIKRIAGSKYVGHWFEDFKISFNSELTAIIGNKGKGKSALADVLGLCGNTHNYSEFSFLKKEKFRKPIPINYSKEFVATITWKSGQTDQKVLNEDPDDLSYERVKYIPQSFLETLCTNVDKKIFEEELEKVIFSRIQNAEKLGKSTLREIINHNKEIIDDAIEQKKTEISKLNTEIVELEYKNSTDYKKLIEESLQQKQGELDAHLTNKPVQINPPSDSADSKLKMQAITDQIEAARNVISTINQQKIELNKEKGQLMVELSELSKLKESFVQLEQQVERSIGSLESIIAKYDLDMDQIINFKVDVLSIDNLLSIKQSRLNRIDDRLNETGDGGFENRLAVADESIKNLQTELDGPNKEYQKYLSELLEWEAIRNSIVGDKTKDGSLEYYKFTKKFLEEELETILKSKYENRKSALTELLESKHRIGQIYRDLYKPVSDFIQQNKNELSDYNVNIDVAFELRDFPAKFFNIVSNGIAGSFCGIAEGNTMLTQGDRGN